LSSSVGEPVPLATKVHFLTAVRSAADRIEIGHGPVASEVTVPVVEVGHAEDGQSTLPGPEAPQ